MDNRVTSAYIALRELLAKGQYEGRQDYYGGGQETSCEMGLLLLEKLWEAIELERLAFHEEMDVLRANQK